MREASPLSYADPWIACSSDDKQFPSRFFSRHHHRRITASISSTLTSRNLAAIPALSSRSCPVTEGERFGQGSMERPFCQTDWKPLYSSIIVEVSFLRGRRFGYSNTNRFTNYLATESQDLPVFLSLCLRTCTYVLVVHLPMTLPTQQQIDWQIDRRIARWTDK